MRHGSAYSETGEVMLDTAATDLLGRQPLGSRLIAVAQAAAAMHIAELGQRHIPQDQAARLRALAAAHSSASATGEAS